MTSGSSNYLAELTVRLAAGVGSLPRATRDLQLRFFSDAQNQDGGFSGREGESDLYYTGFALRAIAVLGALDGKVADSAGRFLRARLTARESIVDFFSLIYGATLLKTASGVDIFASASANWAEAVADTLESLRRDDGGYAKGPEGRASSTYHSFLVLLCLQMIERPVPEPEKLVEFILSRRSDDGGIQEIRASKRAGTNPTAAGIAALRILHALGEDVRRDAADFLLDMQTDEGGLRANTRIPIADLLSSFTGLLTLIDLGEAHQLDLDALNRFASSLQSDEGGFCGAAWDTVCDVEYSFYGLGTLGLLETIQEKK